jgi:hypothetical protein
MNEAYRPVLPHEKRLWKIRHEPRMYEHRKIPMLTPAVVTQERPVEVSVSAGGIVSLALLELLNCLSNPEGSGIEGLEIETPQSEIGKILHSEASPEI